MRGSISHSSVKAARYQQCPTEKGLEHPAGGSQTSLHWDAPKLGLATRTSPPFPFIFPFFPLAEYFSWVWEHFGIAGNEGGEVGRIPGGRARSAPLSLSTASQTHPRLAHDLECRVQPERPFLVSLLVSRAGTGWPNL